MQRQGTENYIDLCWTRMLCVDVDGLYASEPKYTNEDTGCYVSLEKAEMTSGEIVQTGWVGICYCRLDSN